MIDGRAYGQAVTSTDGMTADYYPFDHAFLGRTYGQACALRAVTSTDGMTADYYPFDHAFLGRVANRIIYEVRGINRVTYDITSKPPGTIEWE